MIGNCPIIVDTFCEVFHLLKPIMDDSFYDFEKHTLVPGAIYVVSRQQMHSHVSTFKQLTDDGVIKVVLANPAEGADTMYWQCRHLDLLEYVAEKKILVVSGGRMHGNLPFLVVEYLVTQPFNYIENLDAIKKYQTHWKDDRPYKFLFLNGRMRPHRKYLLEHLRARGVLDQGLWSNLDATTCTGFRNPEWYLPNGDYAVEKQTGVDPHWALTPFPAQCLPNHYEVERYRKSFSEYVSVSGRYENVRQVLFSKDWGEIYIEAAPYCDSYFSLVTETVFDYPYSFRTEKIWKPICVGHPWIAVSNAGYYRDMRNLGFKTFGHLIDESFDGIENSQARIERIEKVVEDLCRRDLVQFLTAAEDVCKYNQQHFIELGPQVPQDFPDRFFQFLNKYFNE